MIGGEEDPKKLFLGRRSPVDKTAEKVVERVELDGVFEWELPRLADNSEFKIPHTLQRRPVGIQRIGGRTPLEFYWTSEQEKRWTSSHVYVHLNPWPVTGQYTGTLPASTQVVDVTLTSPLTVKDDQIAIDIRTQANQANIDWTTGTSTHNAKPLRGILRYNGAGATAPPYDELRIATGNAGTDVSNVDIPWVADISVRPQKGWKYRLRVY